MLASIALVAVSLGSVAASAASAQEGTGAFSDDDGSSHEPALDVLAGRDVLSGFECGEGLICPGEPLKRWEMAVWLVRVLDGGAPAAGDVTRFADVDAESWWSPFVERFAELGITAGCVAEPAQFCPEHNVTRAQMAAFLVRAFDLDPGHPAGFEDTADSRHRTSIDALAAAGVTAGCRTDPMRFCPDRPVTRAQMATFLGRAAGLIELPASVRFTAVAAGDLHTCALRADHSISCWGLNSEMRAAAPDGSFVAVTAGLRHSCGLRADGTIACWGDSGFGQSNAPAGEFSAVAAGGWNTCGLRIDGTVACWGSGWEYRADIPDGQFRAISAGAFQTCALREDDAVVCWGDGSPDTAGVPEGEFSAVSPGDWNTCGVRVDGSLECWGTNLGALADTPPGEFRSVAVGGGHACAVSADDSIVCWGYSDEGATDAPEGQFSSVSAGRLHSCGLRVGGTVACWGYDINNRDDAPAGGLTALSGGTDHFCGLRDDGTAVCWGHRDHGRGFAPQGRFSDVSAGGRHSCGVRPDRTIVCWGANTFGQSSAPAGEFSAVSASRWNSCGLRVDGTVVCWGHSSRTGDVPEGRFKAVAAGEAHSCGLREDGSVVCWGSASEARTDVPEGPFTTVATRLSHSCALRADGTAACWGDDYFGQAAAPEARFSALAVGQAHSCGLRVDGTVVCWGSNLSGETDAPDGEFTAIAASEANTCGLRVDGTVACWGVERIPPPAGARRTVPPDHPDPGACRPHGPTDNHTAGFPLPSWAAPSQGTLRVAVLFVDFPDAVAAHSTRVEAESGLPYAEEYLEAASLGSLDIEFVPLHRWLRAEHGLSHYVTGRGGVEHAINDEAVRRAGSDVDFGEVDIVMVVMPSSHLAGGNSAGEVATPAGLISTVRLNTVPLDEPRDAHDWGSIASHELAHNLGLLDLYTYDAGRDQLPEVPSGRAWIEVQLGLMSIRVRFIASAQDPRLAHVWRYADGYRSTSYRHNLHAIEMLAWSRWQLGWLDTANVACITDREATVSLSPVAAPGAGAAMAAIPLSANEVIVVESRRKIGYDAGLDLRLDEASTTFPALLTEGVLVYTVDARRLTGQLPMTVVGDTGDGQVDDYPMLAVGESVTVRGYTITVISDDGDTHTVTIASAGDG